MPKILAIDGKPDNLIHLSALLRTMMPGCNVITTTSGLQGIKKAQTHLPDTILLDTRMPDMDGYEVCNQLKNHGQTNHIPVIMISTGLMGSEDQVKDFECGADAFLAKPIDPYMLAAKVTAALRIKPAEDKLRRKKKQLEKIVQEQTADLVKIDRQLCREIDEKRPAQEKNKSLESQLLQAQKMESIGLLAGGAAHDYNNSLAVIMGCTEFAIMNLDSKKKLYDTLNQILLAVEQSSNSTRQLLAFARQQTISPKVLDPNQCIKAMINLLRKLIGEDIDLVWLPGRDLWSIKIDPTQLDQILTNLCVNARDAIAGVGKITIKTEKVVFDAADCKNHGCSEPGKFILLSVSDTGSGIDKAILDHIFEPLFTTKEVNKGTGLGLSTVHTIVKKNNGYIKVYSKPGTETAFKIYLPRHKGRPDDTLKEKKEDIPEGRGETILLVEDDSSILKIVQAKLKGLGYIVLTAANPHKAINIAQKNAEKINLIVTDVILPQMNGPKLADALTSICPDIKCVFMSGYTADVVARHGILEKKIHFIQKPFYADALAKMVRKAIE
jgi:signal transduction histidine kinase